MLAINSPTGAARRPSFLLALSPIAAPQKMYANGRNGALPVWKASFCGQLIPQDTAWSHMRRNRSQSLSDKSGTLKVNLGGLRIELWRTLHLKGSDELPILSTVGSASVQVALKQILHLLRKRLRESAHLYMTF